MLNTMRELAIFLVAASLFAGDRIVFDWNKIDPEILDHYLALIRIDTSSPPGNETQAVDYLKRVLDREGIAYEVFALEPAHANLVARIKGNGSKPPVIVMGHLDVVGVQRDKWSVDPFSALRKDGFIYGRGSNDDKDNVTASLMTLVLLNRFHVPLDRDVIFIAESGEEGNHRVGIDFLVNQHWDSISAEYALAEGGYASSRNGKVRFVEVTTTEKVPRTTRLIAHGVAGHGSRPRPDNAVIHLAAAVEKIGKWEPPMRLNDTTRTYFERLATISTPQEAARYNHVGDAKRTSEIQHYFARNELGHYSMLRTSIVPTVIKIGFRQNVIPSEGEATIDVRALPDEDMPKFYDHMRHIINDPQIEVVEMTSGLRPASPPSRLDTEMFHALEAVTSRMFPGAITLPSMLTGATDMAQLREKGVQSYGIGPIVDERSRDVGAAHTDDERLAEDSLYKLVEFQMNAVLEIAASKSASIHP
jgi:acetylornithine deacetylase/succinyl-diaminopimelate desuccinylase-like protein